MTLERSFSQTTFTANNQITTTLFADRPHRTLVRTPSSGCNGPVKASTPRTHPPLSKTNSDHTFLSLKSTPEFTKPGWSPTGSVDDVQLRKRDLTAASRPPTAAKRQLSLQQNNSSSQIYLQKVSRRSSFPHVYRQEGRRVSQSTSFQEPNSQIKENNILNCSSLTQFTEKSSRTSLEKSSSSQDSSKVSKEFLLDFPPMPKSGASHSSAAKRSEKSKEKKGNLKPAQSMPGLVESSSRDYRAHSADARPRQSTSCAFFLIFKRKKKSKEDRSPSPDTRHPTRTSEATLKSEVHSSASNKDYSQLETSAKKERRSSQASSSKERRISQTSSTKERCPSQASSKYHPTPTSSLSVLSPSTTDRTPRFDSRSRLRHRKDRHDHGRTSGSRSHSDPRRHSSHRRVRHEDLPPHPSILKDSAGTSKLLFWSRNSRSRSEPQSEEKSQKVETGKDKPTLYNSNHKPQRKETKSALLKKCKRENNNRKDYTRLVDIVVEPVTFQTADSCPDDNTILAGNLSIPLNSINRSGNSTGELLTNHLCESFSDSDSHKKICDNHSDSHKKSESHSDSIKKSESHSDSIKKCEIRSDSHKKSESHSNSHRKSDKRTETPPKIIDCPSHTNTSASHSDTEKKAADCLSPRKASTSDSEGSSPIVQSNESACGSTPNLKGKSLISTSKTDPGLESSNRPTTPTALSTDNRQHTRSRSLPRFEPHLQFDADTKVISDPEDFEFRPSEMRGPFNLSFCGCGFLGMYHLGVVSCLVQRAPSLLEKIERVGGASAGALMAAVLVTSRDKVEESAEHVQNLAKEIRKKALGALTPGYSFTRSLRYMLDDILPDNAHEIARGKLYISLTNAQTKKNELISDYKSRDELIEALVASCYIPVYAGMKMPTIGGKKYMDGGLSDNMPRFETGRTITVSPFDGKSDIGPKIGQELEKKAHFINVNNQDYQVEVNMNNFKKGKDAFFPPKSHVLQEYFEKGRFDASRFLIREGLYEITTQQQIERVLYESSV